MAAVLRDLLVSLQPLLRRGLFATRICSPQSLRLRRICGLLLHGAKSAWPTSSGPTASARPEPAEPYLSVVLPCRGHGAYRTTRRTFPGDAAALPCRGTGAYSATRRILPGDAAVLPWCRGPGSYSTPRCTLPGDAAARRSRGPPHLRRALSGGGPAAAEQPAAAAGDALPD